MTTLRRNRLDYPLDHPGSIKDGFFIHGYDFGAYEGLDANLEHFEQTRSSLQDFAQQAGVSLIPIQTNLRHLDEDDTFFFTDCFGAALAAKPHLFTPRVTVARIPSSGYIASTYRMGSHPLIDPYYSSAELEIIHDGMRYNRFEKVRLIADWDLALQHLRACFDAFRKDINCGKCEKCLRTMAALLVLGKLKDCPTYPLDDLAPEHLGLLDASAAASIPEAQEDLLRFVYRRLSIGNIGYWRELLQALREIDRHDLADVVAAKLTEYDVQHVPRSRRWREIIKRFDQKFLNGRLRAAWRG